MFMTLVEQLAKAKKIADTYVDAWGKQAVVSQESKAAVLAAMGYDVENEDNLRKQVEKEERDLWTSPLDPVLVVREKKDLQLTVRLPIDLANSELNCTIKVETGMRISSKIHAKNSSVIETKEIDGVTYVKKILTISEEIPLGYHELVLKTVDKDLGNLRLIVVPERCYKQKAINDGLKIWGPSIQLYTLRSETNWGVGDFSDLADLISNLADWGAGFVGLNPIHALYPANPDSASPYSPSSRRWINEIYIDVEAVPELRFSKKAQSMIKDADFQAKLVELRAKEFVDYAGVMKLKLQVLKQIYKDVPLHKDQESDRAKAFAEFVAEGGESLDQLAVYNAIQESYYAKGKEAWGWPSELWEEKYKSYQAPAVKEWAKKHEQDVYFYKYLQFLADEQLDNANATAKESGMAVGIYRDLAVGVSEGSAEIWSNAEIYCRKASVGAPPDPLGPNGQNWGLPPMDPNKLYRDRYQPIIDLFRSNMKSCGSLRIDHAMSLLRLWWVPPKADASKGAYIEYNVNDMIGILALESVRNHCLIIGEDLGTVPDIMKKLLPQSGIHSYKIFFNEKNEQDGGFYSTRDYPAQAMSALTTHDMPTLRGWWHCEDLKLGRKLGVYKTDAIRDNLMYARLIDKQKILDSLNWHGVLPDSVNRNALFCGMDQALNFALQVHMCNGTCALFSTQLEDWLEMEKPVNIPGTSTEYPNWRRKLSKNINEIFADQDLRRLANRMTEARRNASQQE
jgi:4-alpha-glucanotransferase